MNYLFTSLIEMLLDAAIGIFDKLGTSVVKVLALDIGYKNSTFEAVFPIAGDFLGGIEYFAFGILLLNYVWQLVKIMVISDGGVETPLSLTFRTITAGILMFWAPTLIRITQSFFATFYNFLLGTAALDNASFDAVRNSLLTETTETDAAVSANIGDLLFVLIMVAILGYHYMLFLLEAVERYVLLGVLFYTSPLAFSTAGSKSTGNIFSSWVRMVISQFLLMTFNVLFLRLFLNGITRFTESIDAMQKRFADGADGVTTAFVVIWVMMLFAILYVGTRVDSYLSTLGLSAAQTGRGLGAAVMASAAGVRSVLSDAKTAGALGVKAGHGAYGLVKKGIGTYGRYHQKAETTENGVYSKKTTEALVQNNGKLSDKELSKLDPRTLARTVAANLDNVNPNLTRTMTKATIPENEKGKAVNNGRIDMESAHDGKNGTTKMHIQPLSTITDREQLKNCPGVIAKLGGEDVFVQTEGARAGELYKGGEKSILAAGYSQKYNENGKEIPGVYEKVDAKTGIREELHNAGNCNAPTGHASNLSDFEGTSYHHIAFNEGLKEGAYDFSKVGLCSANDPNRMHYGSEEVIASQISDGMLAQMHSQGIVPGVNGAPELTKEDVSNCMREAYVGDRIAPFAASDYKAFIGTEPSLQASAFSSAFPEFKNDPISNISFDANTGNFTLQRTEEDANGNLVNKSYALVNSMSYSVDSSNVQNGEFGYTTSSNGINFAVVPLSEGQSIENVIVPTSAGIGIGLGVQHYENLKTGGIYVDKYSDMSNTILTDSLKKVDSAFDTAHAATNIVSDAVSETVNAARSKVKETFNR